MVDCLGEQKLAAIFPGHVLLSSGGYMPITSSWRSVQPILPR
jgi:hypothetical protein